MSVDAWFLAILHGNDVVRFGNRDYTNPIRYWRLDSPQPPGEYIAVELGRGNVDGTFLGLVDVRAFAFTLPQSPTELVGDTPSHEINLLPSQGASVIQALESKVPYMWKNATESARTKLSGGFGEKPEERAHSTYREGRTRCEQGDRVAGLAKVNQAISEFPGISNARAWLGQMAIKDGNLELATKHFEDELRLASEPDDFGAHAYLAAIFQELGQAERGREHAEAAMATEAYRKTGGMSLSSSVVDEIRRAAAKTTKTTHGSATRPQPLPPTNKVRVDNSIPSQEPSALSATRKKRWWEIWK